MTDRDIIGPAYSGTKADPDGPPVSVSLSGRVTFDRLPVTATGLGPTPSTEPAALVLIEAVAHGTLYDVIATTTTDANGDYQLTFDTGKDFYVRARAQTGVAPDVDRVIHPGTPSKLVWAQSSGILNRSQAPHTVDLYARALGRAGAFAILDTVWRLRATVAASFASPGSLDVFWSFGSEIAESGMLDSGPLGNPTIFLPGGLSYSPFNGDHDEFDETVIAHEWCHFLTRSQSRDNNFDGPHAGQELVFNAAYAEGAVTAIGCALLGTSLYRDTAGYSVLPPGLTVSPPSLKFEFDCESGLLPGTGLGYGGEFHVARVVWDLLDGGAGWPPDADGDPAAIDMADFFASFAALKTRAAPYAVAWLASLLQQLIDDGHLTAQNADALMQAHGASFPPAGGADPFPELLVPGGGTLGVSLDAWSGASPNPVLGPQANAVFRIELAAPQTVTISVANSTAAYNAANHRVDLTVHHLNRDIVASDTGAAQNKAVQVALDAGTYIVRVQHLPAAAIDSKTVTLSVQAQ